MSLAGAYEQAIHLFTERGFLNNLDLRVSVPEALVGLAATAFVQGQVERAARLAGAAEALHGFFGSFISPTVLAINAEYVARIRSQMEAQRFSEAWDAGCAMSFEQAIAYAVGDTGTSECARPA